MPFQVGLSKERFKFSSTHFTIFNAREAECLHGHNYQVSVDFDFQSMAVETGLAVEFNLLKNAIDRICNDLDEKVLLPQNSPFLNISQNDGNIEVKFSKKFYSFPIEDCFLLKVVNISSECLAHWFHQTLEKEFQNILGLDGFSVTIEETNGQSVTYFPEENKEL